MDGQTELNPQNALVEPGIKKTTTLIDIEKNDPLESFSHFLI